MSGKRKRVVVSLETKFNAIKRLDNGESIKKVAADLGVGEVTVGDWRRKREEIEKYVNKSLSVGGVSSRKTLKKGDYEQTCEALFLWFSQLRGMGSPVSGPMLQAKALEFHKKFKDGEEKFTASEGWLDRWKKRYGVRQLNISGEKLSADSSEIAEFQKNMEEIVLKEGLTSDQIFNSDETGLNFRMLPSKTLAAKSERTAPGFKKSKERVTILATANASGSLKLRPLLIGKAKNPRAFKNVKVDCLPTMYRNQRNAWMDGPIFSDWFYNEFVPVTEAFLKKKKLPRKAVLLLDNAPSHPDAKELCSDGIKTIFLPPNVTSLIQPLDQGILEAMKRIYRRKLLQMLISKLDEGMTVKDALKQVTLKDVSYWIASAWDEVKITTVQKSWKNLFGIDGPYKKVPEPENMSELVELANELPVDDQINSEDIRDWCNQDVQMEITDEEIIDMVTGAKDSEGDDNMDEITPKISYTDGLKSIDAALAFIEQQEECTPHDILFLQRWRNIASSKRGKRLSQKTIKDFFKK